MPSADREHEGIRGLGTILDGMFGRRGTLRRPVALDEVRRAWLAAAGAEVGGHTRVASLRRGVLTVEVDSPPLCHKLASFDKERLLVAIKERVRKSEVSELRFRLGAFTGD